MDSDQQNQPPDEREALEIRCGQLEQELAEQKREVAAFKRQLERFVSLQESERQSVSRDIHDSLGQLLTGLRMEISSLQSKLERPPLNRSEIVALVGRADQLIERIQKSIRDLVSFLQPRVVIEKGLAAAIQSIIWENERYGDIQYETAVDLAEDALDQDQAIAVYRIVQECLTNVVRHAKASRVRIRCVSERESLLVQIEDNGVGYDATAESSGEGWGLFGIRTRVKLLSGTISIKSALGQGTRVFVEIPLVKGRDV